MRLLPTEQIKAQERTPALLQRIEDGEKIMLEEPCDCGSRITHNNGGNYHDIVSLQKDIGAYFIKEDSTYEESDAQWDQTTKEEIEKRIREALSQGWYVS